MKSKVSKSFREVSSELSESKYPNFIFKKRIEGNYRTTVKTGKKKFYKYENGFQEYYKTEKSYDVFDLDYDVEKILYEPNVSGVVVVFKIMDEENETIHFASDYIVKSTLLNLQANDVSIYEHLSQKIKRNKSLEEFDLKGVFIRVIYENPS